MAYSRYDSFDGDSYDGDDETELKLTPHAEISFIPDELFGVPANQYGQTMGLNMTDVQLIDGAVYKHPDKDQFKVFSWEESVGMSPLQGFIERGNFDPTDASDLLPKTYAGNSISYEFVMCRMPEVVVPDDYEGDDYEPGEVLADTVAYEYDNENHEKVEVEADVVAMPDCIMWLGGSQKHGPASATKTIAKTFSSLGNDVIVDEDDINNWVADTSKENILRDDMEGRRVRLFKIQKQSNESGYTFHHANILDDELGERIPVNNNDGGSTGSVDAAEHAPNMASEAEPDDGPEQVEAEAITDYPEPLTDFVTTSQKLDMDEENAEDYLNDMIKDDNNLSESMIEDFGGREKILAEATGGN